MWYNRGVKNVVAPAMLQTSEGWIRLDWRHIMDNLPPHAQIGKPYTIYTLIDPRDYQPRYVGITKDVYERFVRHIRCDGDNPAKDAWIQELRALNQMVIMQVVGTTHTREEALRRETEWIHAYHTSGYQLFNKEKMPKVADSMPVPSGKKLACYNGKRARYTDNEINQILDWYLLTGELPQHVSERQRRTYRKHPKLEERKRLLAMSFVEEYGK